MNQMLFMFPCIRVDWKGVIKKAAPLLMVLTLALLVTHASVMDFACTDIWNKSQNTAKDIYDNVMSLSTYVAGVMFIIALAISFFSKDQRKVDASIDWAKRIFIVYLLILGAGWIFQYGRELTSEAPDIFGGN